jgi:MFS family permease
MKLRIELDLKMFKESFGSNVKELKKLFLVIFLLINSLTWYYMERRTIFAILDTFSISPQQNLTIWGTWDLAIISSGIIGALLSGKIRRSKILYLWIILGIITSLLVCFLPLLSLAYVFPISFLCSISFGLGMPSCLAYFADQTFFENRGAASGLIFFVSSAITPLIILLSGINFMLSSVAAIWRAFGFLVLFFSKPSEKETSFEGKQQTTLRFIFTDKQVLFYFIPWFMFSLVYGFQKVTLEQSLQSEFYDYLLIIQSISATISAIFGGLVCDKVGRKRVVIFGFVLLGIAYAVVGIAPTEFIFSLYFYSVIDGIAWGIFITIFVLTLWGDFSFIRMRHAEKYYAAGSIPFFFADFAGLIFAYYVWVPISSAFSIASFFLFLAVVPLMFAPETLPEKKLRERELRQYIEKAKKIKEKYL